MVERMLLLGVVVREAVTKVEVDHVERPQPLRALPGDGILPGKAAEVVADDVGLRVDAIEPANLVQ